MGPIGLLLAARSRPSTITDRLGRRLLLGVAVILDVLGTIWTVLYLLAHYLGSGLF
jgi:hypothetical protein